MSLVDYTIAVRRRPEWRRVRLQPGLWLAWAVMIAALLMAIAPQWLTSSNPLEDPRRSAPGAAGALLVGYRPAGARPVDAGGLRRGAFPVGGADRRRHRPGGGYHPWHPRRGAGRTRGIHHHAPGRYPAGHPLPAAAAYGDYSAGFRHGKCGGGGWRRGYRQLRAPGASRSGTRAPQRLRRGGPGQRRHFFAVFWRHILPNSLTAVLAFATLQFGQAMLALATLSFLGYGTPPPVPEWGLLIAEGRNYLSTAWWLTTFPGLAVVAVVLAANRLSRQWSGVRP